MNEPVPIDLNLNNLKDIFARISHLEAFIFYGTLLGYEREGNIIPHDDDVDIYLNAKNLDQLLLALVDSNFKIKILPKYRWYYPRKRPLVVQASRSQRGIETFVDFYLYIDDEPNYLIEKWNFGSTWRDQNTALHVPKNLVFPLLEVEMQGIKIKVPAYSERICAFLYGQDWKIPATKNKDYTTQVVNNVPVNIIKKAEHKILKLLYIKIKSLARSIYYRI
jgi:phosphorylcholine metabolism protein LicD